MGIILESLRFIAGENRFLKNTIAFLEALFKRRFGAVP